MSGSDLGKNRNTKIKYEAFDDENGLLFTGNFLIELLKGILEFFYGREEVFEQCSERKMEV